MMFNICEIFIIKMVFKNEYEKKSKKLNPIF